VALSAADFRFCHILMIFQAVCGDFYSSFEVENQTGDFSMQFLVWAGICTDDTRNRTGFAQIRRPMPRRLNIADEFAFFMVSTTIVISIKKFAFETGRSLHLDDLPLF